MLLAGFPNPVRLSLTVDLHDGDALVRDVRCSLHAAGDEPCDGHRRIRLFPGERLDRDFILRFRLGDATIRSTLTLHPDQDDHRGNIRPDGRPAGRAGHRFVAAAGGGVRARPVGEHGGLEDRCGPSRGRADDRHAARLRPFLCCRL